MLANDLLEMLLDVDAGKRQHAVAQRQFQPAELVEPEQVHDQAEGGRIHEQREQHEQHRGDRNEVAHRLGKLLVACRDHRQHDRHRTAQAAPYQDRLVTPVHRLDEPEALQDRQHSEHDQSAGRESADGDRENAPDIEPGDLQQHVGRDHRGQDEDQAVRPEFKLRPHLPQRGPLPRMQVRGAVGGDGQRGHHHGDNA